MENEFIRRLLFIAYFYPPLGGPGVQRPVKTIKYLKELGWEIDVLTVLPIRFHSYDYELLAESKADNIYRTGSLDPMRMMWKISGKKSGQWPVASSQKKSDFEKLDSLDTHNLDTSGHRTLATGHSSSYYFKTPERLKRFIRGIFPIDDKICWYPFAYKKALSLLKSKHYDAIVTTIGPYTSGVLAYNLSKKTQVPYFIDYRDHWTLHPYITYAFKFLYKHAQKHEKRLLQNARGVFVVGNMMRQKLIDAFGEYLAEKTVAVFNGFDETDFSDGINFVERSEFIIRYVGNLYGNRNANYLIKALEELKAIDAIPKNVRIEFIGNYYKETIATLQTPVLKEHIQIFPQVEHSQAIYAMRTADLLLFFVATKDGDDFITGKGLEYARANVPILAMIPPTSEIAQILKSLGHKYICPMEDVEGIKRCLRDIFGEIESRKSKVESMDGVCGMRNAECEMSEMECHISTYSRENQSKIFHDFLVSKLK